jgi:hypothetical protein
MLRLLPIFNVGEDDIPPDDVAFAVAQRQTPRMEPAVDAVGALDTRLNIVRISGFDRSPPAVGCVHPIVRMYGRQPILHFLRRFACIIPSLPIHRFGLAIGFHGGHPGGNAVDHYTKVQFARAHRFFRFLSRGYVHRRADIFHGAGFAHPTSENVKMFHGPTRHEKAMFEIQIGARLTRAIQNIADLVPVLRMYPFKYDLE